MNQPPIPPKGLDSVIKRQLETSLHGQYAFAEKTVWMGWIFTFGAIAFGLYWAWFAIQHFSSGEMLDGLVSLGVSAIAAIVAYGMWTSHRVQKELSRQYRDDMDARSRD
ncbi:MAG: hypothetical protein AAFQ85_10315 [Pseudomonadota bacterium]